MKAKGMWMVIGICALVFAPLAISYESLWLSELDRSILQGLREMERDGLTGFFLAVTFLGSTVGILLVTLLAVVWSSFRGRWLDALTVFVAVVGSWLLNTLLKNLFQRPRPDILHLAEADGFSFPSGHAMIGISTYAVLAFLIGRAVKGTGTKTAIAVFFGLIILLIGLSRNYLGLHDPTDIVAGYAAGIAWLCVCTCARRAAEPHIRN